MFWVTSFTKKMTETKVLLLSDIVLEFQTKKPIFLSKINPDPAYGIYFLCGNLKQIYFLFGLLNKNCMCSLVEIL